MPEFIEPVIPPQSQEGMPLPEAQVLLEEPPVVEDPPASMMAIDQLNAYLEMTNIADDVDDDVLKEIGSKVIEDFKIDKDSREEWEEMIDGALELAKQVIDKKYFAGELVANVKYPALSTAAIQFHARALPNIIKGRDVVKGKVIGISTPPELPEISEQPTEEELITAQGILDQQADVAQKQARAERVGNFMSYQFLEEIGEWQDDLDQLLISLPIVGCAFKKTFLDTVDGKPESSYVSAKDLVVNYKAKSLKTASRVSHVLELSPTVIEERMRGEVFLDVDLGEPAATEGKDPNDDEAPHEFIEMHTRWDLDDDGYKEPYVITVHKESEEVVRIVARFDADGVISNEKGDIVKIEPVQYFTRFLFMPAFDGNFYGMGFGGLMSHLNATINDTINLLLDSGARASLGGGWLGKGINLAKNAVTYLKKGEWKHTTNTGDDLRKGIVPAQYKEPSAVLFQLLGLMLEATKEVSSVSDVLTGEQQGANASPTTTLALIEQGLKVFSSVYKRLQRSLKSEFQKVRRLNRLYLDPKHYIIVLDDQNALIEDFYEKDIDIIPVSDETELTHIQKLIKAEALMNMKGTGLNDREIDKRYLEAMELPDIEKLLPAENAEPEPDPELLIKQGELEVKKMEADNDARRVQIEEQLAEAKIRKSDADTERSEATAQQTREKGVKDEFIEKVVSLEKIVEMQSKTIQTIADRIVGEG